MYLQFRLWKVLSAHFLFFESSSIGDQYDTAAEDHTPVPTRRNTRLRKKRKGTTTRHFVDEIDEDQIEGLPVEREQGRLSRLLDYLQQQSLVRSLRPLVEKLCKLLFFSWSDILTFVFSRLCVSTTTTEATNTSPQAAIRPSAVGGPSSMDNTRMPYQTAYQAPTVNYQHQQRQSQQSEQNSEQQQQPTSM
jgi:hypothetical protein